MNDKIVLPNCKVTVLIDNSERDEAVTLGQLYSKISEYLAVNPEAAGWGLESGSWPITFVQVQEEDKVIALESD